jgi:hypothetical protein
MRLAILIAATAALLSACIEPSPTPCPTATPDGRYHVIKSSQQ